MEGSVAMANHPRVMLPIITYNLVQHLVAGAVALSLADPMMQPKSLASVILRRSLE
jgi:hypothetical protein